LIIRTPGGRAEVRDMFAGTSTIPQPMMSRGGWSNAGRLVSADDAVGLPAALAAVRLLAETTGELPCIVRRDGEAEPERVPTSSQWSLLHNEPNEDQSPFDFFAYLVASLQQSNAYILKTKSRRQVMELIPLDPETVFPFHKDGQMQYRVYREGKSTLLTREDIIHIPGVLWRHPYIGVSPIAMHRNSLGASLAAEEFGNRFFTNGGAAGGIIEVPDNPNKQQKEEIIEGWNAGHRGVANAHKTGLLTNGAKYQPLGVTMQDAAYVESQRFSVQQIARIFRVPASMIGDDSAQKPSNTHPEVVNQAFLQFSLQPWLTRIEQGLAKDPDLFPTRTLKPSFVVEAILRADITSRYQAYLWAKQAGWLTANEIRAKEDMPEIEGGDQLQATPVGGAPNPEPQPGPEPTKTPDPEPDDA
jgi:HK97 family phage portal protein